MQSTATSADTSGISSPSDHVVRNRMAAKQELERAFLQEPTNTAIALKLFNVQLAASEIGAAEQTFAFVRAQLTPATALACEAKLAVRKRDQNAAMEALRELCLSPDGTPSLIEAANVFFEAGWGAEAERIFRNCADHPACNPEVGTILAERIVQHKAWGRRKEIYDLRAIGELGRRAFLVYIHALGEKKKNDLLKRLLDRYPDWLKQDVRTWGAIGYALVACDEHKRAARWLKNWRKREGVMPWHLYNYALALRHMGRDREARAVSLHALSMPQQDDSRSDHQLWLAFDDALVGKIESAEQRLAEFDGHGLKECARMLRTMTRSIIDVRESPRRDRGAEFRSARRRLKRDYRENIGKGPKELRRAYRRAIRRMARDSHCWPGLTGFFGPLTLPKWPGPLKWFGF